MNAAKCLCDMAIPANRQMCAESLLEVLCRDVLPFDRTVLFIQQCRRMVMPTNLLERLMAIDAVSSGVPLVDNRTNETRSRGFFNLRQTRLPAIFTFGPTGALA
jgi:hypothetical protein